MRCLMLGMLVVAAPAVAEVKSVTEHGFEVAAAVDAKASPSRVYEALGQIGAWWNGAHTYSGDARNLSLDARPGGCFCEAIPADGARIEHGRTVYAQPGQMLRLHAALGPLQGEGASGALTFTLKPLADGRTQIAMSYVVGGYVRAGMKTLAPAVDGVLGEQLSRLRAYAER